MTDENHRLKQHGYKDIRKASATGRQVRMSLTGFAKPDERYEITKTKNGFEAEVYDNE